MRISKRCGQLVFILVFVLCVILMDQGLKFLLYPYTYARVDVHYLETQQYDDIFVGTSHGKCGIDPLKVDEVTGRKSFNFCMGGQFTVDSYYIVKEACRVNPPKRVIYELDPAYWMLEIPQDTTFGQTYQELPWSLVKAEYFFAKFTDTDFRNALFPWYAFRSQMEEIGENIETKTSSLYKEYGTECFREAGQTYEEGGFIRRIPVKGEHKSDADLVLWNEEGINPDRIRYFEKLVKLCQEQGIELVAVTTPVPKENLEKYREYEKADTYFTNYFRETGVPYINYNTEANHPGYSVESDYADYDGHMYGDTADAFSRILGEALKKGVS